MCKNRGANIIWHSIWLSQFHMILSAIVRGTGDSLSFMAEQRGVHHSRRSLVHAERSAAPLLPFENCHTTRYIIRKCDTIIISYHVGSVARQPFPSTYQSIFLRGSISTCTQARSDHVAHCALPGSSRRGRAALVQR